MKVAAYKEHFIRRHYGLTLNGDYKMKKFTLSSLLAFTFFGLAPVVPKRQRALQRRLQLRPVHRQRLHRHQPMS